MRWWQPAAQSNKVTVNDGWLGLLLLGLLFASPGTSEKRTSMADDSVAPPHPRTVAFWAARIFLAVVIVLVCWCGLKIAFGTINTGTNRMLRDSDKQINSDLAPPTPKPVVYDEAWLRRARAEVAALDSEVQAAKEAYARHENSLKSHTISREDDRRESARLNEIILGLEQKRAEAAQRLAEHE